MMVLQHNLTSMFTNRQLGITNTNKSKSTEKLSSGYRINRASDDAAGLSISEKMRSQIRGLNRAANNIQDGINLIHTADGAMNEDINILQRIRELTIQAYNTAVNQPEDMQSIQNEVDELLKEIQRISENTEFNKKKVLQGNEEHTFQTDEVAYVERTRIINSTAGEFPLPYDDKMTLNNPKVPSTTLQDTSKYVTFKGGTDDAYSRGPVDRASENDNWLGEWGETLAENLTATVDFTSLFKAASAENFSSILRSMEATGIGYGCGSCDRIEAVIFSGNSFSNVRCDMGARIMNNTIVDLSDFEDRAEEFGATYGYSPDDETFLAYGEENIEDFDTLTEDQKKDKYNELFSSFRENMTDEILDKIVQQRNSLSGHFMRATKVGTSDSRELVFYDLRDVDDESGMPAGLVNPVVEAKITVSAIEKYYEQTDDGTVTKKTPSYLQVGANSQQGIYLTFPDMSLSNLGISDYTIYPPEGYCTAPGHSTYDLEFLNTCTSLGDNKYVTTVNTGGTAVTRTEQRSYTVSGVDVVYGSPVCLRKAGTDEYGESVPAQWTVPVASRTPWTRTYTYDYEWTEYVGGTNRNVEFVAYPPDTILRIDNAISYVSSERSRLGAMENRLEYAYKVDKNTEENLQDAESRIRDTDMSEEMTRFAKENMLEQAGISVLSQANQKDQMVLQLLQA